jgi:hypothetical protein
MTVIPLFQAPTPRCPNCSNADLLKIHVEITVSYQPHQEQPNLTGWLSALRVEPRTLPLTDTTRFVCDCCDTEWKPQIPVIVTDSAGNWIDTLNDP